MSLLAPLYFLGALAVGLPVLFHLIRRRPRGEISFSSLMFLRASPPRLTKRSRLDNWLLLLIRALALILLAAAFARPFVRASAQRDSGLGGRRTVLLVDTSASMRRGDLWRQAAERAATVLDDLQPGDELAVVAFADQPETLVSFEQASRLDVAQLRELVESELAEVSPSWQATDLGRAIAFAADLAVTYEADDTAEVARGGQAESPTRAKVTAADPAQLVLISDLQAGSEIESLQGFPWPDHLQLDLRRVTPARHTNAWAQRLAASQRGDGSEAPERGDGSEASKRGDRVRVRVSNSSDASASQFRLAWGDPQGRAEQSSGLPASVPPGQSRVIRLESPTPQHGALVVTGDDFAFDNTRYFVSPQPRSVSLIYLGPEASEPRESLLYYLQRVPLSDNRLDVTIEAASSDAVASALDPEQVPLVVLAQSVSSDVAEQLNQYIAAGGRVLYVLASSQASDATEQTLQSLSGDGQLSVEEAHIDDYAMLSRIDFQHPLFAAMRDPQFSDFTKIRFWAHRDVSGLSDAWHRVAAFDDAQPALLERSLGDGTLWVLTAGWQPTSSQLALSSKFPPLMLGFLDLATGREEGFEEYVVGDPIEIEPSPGAKIARIGGEPFAYEAPEDAERIDRPGVYEWTDGEQSRSFAVNLHPAESRTEPLSSDQLEGYGVVLGKPLTHAQRQAQQRQARDLELENRQKLWQWLLAAALGLLALETWLGGWLSRRQLNQPAAPITA